MNDVHLGKERRKEERLVLSESPVCELWIQKNNEFENSLGTFGILNLSKLGLALKINQQNEFWKEVKLGSSVCGAYFLREERISFSAVVRVISQDFLGLEYSEIQPQFLIRMKKILSPEYVANSIYELSSENLDDSVLAAFRGLDFECVIFKDSSKVESASETKVALVKRIQFFLDGVLLELSVSEARVIPRMLMRRHEKHHYNNLLMRSYSRLAEDPDVVNLQEALSDIRQICRIWKPSNQEIAKSIFDIVTSASLSLS
jgi:hypothetical protein